MIRPFVRLATLVTVPFIATMSASAMMLNLAVPWNPDTSAKENKVVHDAHIDFYSCDEPNLLFTSGKEIVIEARPPNMRAVAMSYAVSKNMFLQPFITGDAEALPAARFIIRVPTEKLTPGFYDINVVLDCGEKEPYKAKCTFGWKVSELPITPDKPADFDAFWKEGKAELAKIPVDAHVGDFQTFNAQQIDDYNVTSACLPPDYDPKGHRSEEVESAKVDFAGIGGVRIHGWLAKPPGNGPFPAMLVLPGAGFAARPRPLEHARHGFLALDIQIHGQEVDLPGEYPKIPGYYDHQVWDPPTGFYYYNVYLNCVQAINYLESRPDVDKSRIVVVGGSQGGRLTIMLSGLDHQRVAACVPAIVHNANIPFLKWFDAANKANPKQDGMDRDAPPPLPDTPEGKTQGYYDVMNFAPYITCPVYQNAGLIDPISPPDGSWAVFNQIGSKDKTITPLPGQGHDWSAEFDRRAWRWLDKELDLQPVPGPALKPNGP
jgi:cephalosporin-C deacetylase-like acetyl esterase